jgi:RNA polymerase sigma-70 factor (ECF subfamily)
MRSNRTDDELVLAGREGDSEALGELFERHWTDAWRLARSVVGSETTADDVAQEAFVKAVRNLRRLKAPSTFRWWLHRIVYNAAMDELRVRGRSIPMAQPVAATDQATVADDGFEAVFTLLAAVSPEQKAALVLRYCLDYSLAEVAQILGVPVGTVQSRASRGLSELRAYLEGQER